MNYTLDLKLLWEIVVTLVVSASGIVSWIALRSRREGASDEAFKALGARVEKAESTVKKHEKDSTDCLNNQGEFEGAIRRLDDTAKKHEADLQKHAREISLIREEVAKLPTRQELQNLATQLSAVQISIGDVSGQLRGVANTLSLMNQHLMSRGEA